MSVIRCSTCGKTVKSVDKISLFQDLEFCTEKCRAEFNMRQDLIDSGVDMAELRRVIMDIETELWRSE